MKHFAGVLFYMLLACCFAPCAAAAEVETYTFDQMFQVREGSVFGIKRDYISIFPAEFEPSSVSIYMMEQALAAEGIPQGAYSLTQVTTGNVIYHYYTVDGSLKYHGYDCYAMENGALEPESRMRFADNGFLTSIPASMEREKEYTETLAYTEFDFEDQTEESKTMKTIISASSISGSPNTDIGPIANTYYFSGTTWTEASGSDVANNFSQYRTIYSPTFAWLIYNEGIITGNEFISTSSKRLKGAYVDGVAYPQNGAAGLVDMGIAYGVRGTTVNVYASIFGDREVEIYFTFVEQSGRMRSLGADGVLLDGVAPYVTNLSLTALMPQRPFNLPVGSVTFDDTWEGGVSTLYMVVCEPGGLLSGKMYSVDTQEFAVYTPAATTQN